VKVGGERGERGKGKRGGILLKVDG